jgi:transposase
LIRGLDWRDRGAVPEIPTKRNRHVQDGVNRPLHALRNRIERFINRLKNSRRVATRYDRTADSFLGLAALSSIRLWTKFVHAPQRFGCSASLQCHDTAARR